MRLMDLADRIQRIVSILISVTLTVALASAVYQGQWFNAFLAFLAIGLSYLPALIERNYKIGLPIEFEFMLALFLFLGLYLGSIEGYFVYFWWWDVLLHGISGVILGLVGFILAYILRTEHRFGRELRPGFVALFSFVFAVTLGTLWEILEFIIDQFHLNDVLMQRDNFDTMKDLIDDSLGALIVAFSGYFYVKKVKIPIFHRIIAKFVMINPSLFHRLRRRSQSFIQRRLSSIRNIRSNTLHRVRRLMNHLRHPRKSRRP